MAIPTLTPTSQTSAVTLPSSSLPGDAADAAFPFSVYTGDDYFLSGAADQVAYTYNKLGGEVLDIELTKEQVFSAYQEAVLEYSYLLNIHQAKNSLSDYLGANTGSFDEEGQIQSGDDLDGKDISLRFPKPRFAYARRVGRGYTTEGGFDGETPIYSASFSITQNQQDYDLQQIISSSADDGVFGVTNPVGDKRVNITRVFYKTPHAMWRFYGYYGGLNVVGNMAMYGQFTDDSTFQLVPVWQNKAQAMAFEDAIYTRNSQYSYEIKNNKIRIFPSPPGVGYPKKMWVEFFVDSNTPWDDDSGADSGVEGISNINTLPFENIPYQKINSIGKQWIRRFTLALCKEILGNLRSKFATIPIPGASVTLNGTALLGQAATEQEKLREELKTIFDELTYAKLSAKDAELGESINKIQQKMPHLIYTG